MEQQVTSPLAEECLNVAMAAANALTAASHGEGVKKSLSESLATLLASEARDLTNLQAVSRALPDRLRRHLSNMRDVEPETVQRHLEARAHQWSRSVAEMLERLGCDWHELVAAWNISPDAAIEFVSSPMGDLHNNGRSVYQLRFSDGQSIFYKPRSVQAEHAFARVIDYLAQRGCEPDLHPCRVLPKEGYGWSKYVPHVWCRNSEEASTFYYRQGAFLALFWLLCGDDATSDNLVVHGDHPVWVDTECMCLPDVAFANVHKSRVPPWIQDSLLTTGMVFYGKVPGVSPRLMTGLHRSCAVHRSSVFSTRDMLKAQYVRDVARGFERVYSWLLSHREEIEGEHGIHEMWRGLHMRVLLRPTRLYAALVELWSVTDEARRDDVARDISDLLESGEDSDGAAGPWPRGVVRQEMAAVRRGDIPYWTTSTSACEIREAGGQQMERIGAIPGMERMRRRTARMSAEDMARQVWLIGAYLGHSESQVNRELA